MKNYKIISMDRFKIIAAILIIAIHTFPLYSINETLDFVFTHIICRIGVPFFLMVTGFFILPKTLKNKNELIKYIIKISKIYAICIILYLPLNIYAGQLRDIGIIGIIKKIFIDGTFYHLWYFPALILGICISYFLLKKLNKKCAIIFALFLYLIGIFGDSYFGISEKCQVMNIIYNFIFNISEQTRNGLFFVPIFLILGYMFSLNKLKLNNNKNIIFIIVSMILMIIEGLILHNFNLQRHTSMYFMLIPLMISIFNYILSSKSENNKKLRNIATIIYIIHPIFIIFVRGIGKLVHIEYLLIDNNLIHYLLVVILSVTFSLIYEIFKNLIKKFKYNKNIITKDRAWIEINYQNLENNINEIKKIIPETCNIMAVVKANAYGHGIIEISKYLNKIGINNFAVATLEEGILLRKNKVTGNILILGYTSLEDIKYVIKYNLIQTIIDYDYAKELNNLKLHCKRIRAHIKINTGMNRIGESYHNIDNIKKIYNMSKLKIEGIFSHLCVSDSTEMKDIEFTKMQIKNFDNCINELKKDGYNVGKTHIQSSYGVLNYPELKYDYVRIGIIMYGIYSSNKDIPKTKLNIKPVLSLKSKVTSIKEINVGESVGYGRSFIADNNMKIASISIGYGDGYPRNLSNCGVKVLINGEYAEIIGRICMDQLIVDVSNISQVKTGDIVTLIGSEKDISAESIAEKSDTITNELLSRLGRLLK